VTGRLKLRRKAAGAFFERGSAMSVPPFSIIDGGFEAGRKITPLMICWHVHVAGCGR
jgi:hypothetical protein